MGRSMNTNMVSCHDMATIMVRHTMIITGFLKNMSSDDIMENSISATSPLIFYRLSNSVARRQSLAHPLSELLGTTAIAIILWFGGSLILGSYERHGGPRRYLEVDVAEHVGVAVVAEIHIVEAYAGAACGQRLGRGGLGDWAAACREDSANASP